MRLLAVFESDIDRAFDLLLCMASPASYDRADDWQRDAIQSYRNADPNFELVDDVNPLPLVKRVLVAILAIQEWERASREAGKVLPFPSAN